MEDKYFTIIKFFQWTGNGPLHNKFCKKLIRSYLNMDDYINREIDLNTDRCKHYRLSIFLPYNSVPDKNVVYNTLDTCTCTSIKSLLERLRDQFYLMFIGYFNKEPSRGEQLQSKLSLRDQFYVHWLLKWCDMTGEENFRKTEDLFYRLPRLSKVKIDAYKVGGHLCVLLM